MRGLPAVAHPSAPFSMLRPDADPSTSTAYDAPRARRGLLSGIVESVGDFLGFGNNQAHPSDPKDAGNGGASSTGANDEHTSVKPPVEQPSPPAQAQPASYPKPGGGGQVDKPTASAPISVSPAPQSSSAGTEPERAPHSTRPPAMNIVPSVSTASPAHESQHVSDIYGGPATSTTATRGWPSMSSSLSSAPSPTDAPTPSEHAQQFPPAAAAAIGAVLGFVVVSALFWAVWIALRKRRRATREFPEFASVHPKWVSVPESVGAAENPFTNPHDEKEEDPFDAALCRASTSRSLASTLSV